MTLLLQSIFSPRTLFVKQLNTIIAFSVILLLLDSCNKMDGISGEDISGYSPIFVSAENVSPLTKSYLPTGMYDNFEVYATYEMNGMQQIAMDGYHVRFGAEGWSYITDSQSLAYWNVNADRYLFAAGAPIEAVTSMDKTSMTLQLENNLEGSAMASEPLTIAKSSSEFGKVVNLHFHYAHCRICVAFVKNSDSDTEITNIKLTPGAPIASKAEMEYNYDWSITPSTATTLLTTTETDGASLNFANVTIPADTEDAVLSETKYYCVPDAANTNSWSVSLTCDGENKSTSFVTSDIWKSGKNYIFLFSLTDKNVKLVKVISQDDFFDCNDIVPGGDFSNNDMTE